MTVVDKALMGQTALLSKGTKAAENGLADAKDAKSAFDDAFADVGKKKQPVLRDHDAGRDSRSAAPDEKNVEEKISLSLDENDALPNKHVQGAATEPKADVTPSPDETKSTSMPDAPKAAKQSGKAVETETVGPSTGSTGMDRLISMLGLEQKPQASVDANQQGGKTQAALSKNMDSSSTEQAKPADPKSLLSAVSSKAPRLAELEAAVPKSEETPVSGPAPAPVDMGQLLTLLTSARAIEPAVALDKQSHQLEPAVSAFQALAERAGHIQDDSKDESKRAETGEAETDSSKAPTDTTFRFVRADGKGREVSMTVGSEGKASPEGTDKAAAKVEMVTVLEARRYLGLSPNNNAAAVTGAISSAVGQSAAGTASPALSAPALATEAATGKVVNTLKIQMHPIDLGLVTATLRLKDDELHVHLKVESGEAFRQLSDNQNDMVKALRQQGFAVDQMTITFNAPDSASSNAPQQAQTQTSQQGRDGAGEGSQGRGQRGSDNSGQQGSNGNWTGTDAIVEASVSGDARESGDLYM